jgi:hypothetical protein
VTGPAQRSAAAALDAARQVIARLDSSRHAEDVAADLIEGWSAVETALRSLLGGSALSGTALLAEVRQRQMLSFDQANALAAFYAARERAERTDYKPTRADVDAAREGFLKLEAAVMPPTPSAGAPTVGGAAGAPLRTVTPGGTPIARWRSSVPS